jgi:hypothetical protein
MFYEWSSPYQKTYVLRQHEPSTKKLTYLCIGAPGEAFSTFIGELKTFGNRVPYEGFALDVLIAEACFKKYVTSANELRQRLFYYVRPFMRSDLRHSSRVLGKWESSINTQKDHGGFARPFAVLVYRSRRSLRCRASDQLSYKAQRWGQECWGQSYRPHEAGMSPREGRAPPTMGGESPRPYQDSNQTCKFESQSI